MRYQLSKPLYNGPAIISAVELREPTAREVAAFGLRVTGDDFADALLSISLCTQVDVKILEQLGAKDFIALSTLVADLFKEFT